MFVVTRRIGTHGSLLCKNLQKRGFVSPSFLLAMERGQQERRIPASARSAGYSSLGVSAQPIPFPERRVNDLLNLSDMSRKIGSWTVNADETVFEATRKMVEHRTGSLCVTDDEGKVVGIITERDYLRKVLHQGRRSQDTMVRDIATMKNLIVASPEEYLQDCIDVMVRKDIRHLPVAEDDGTIVALLDIQDLAKALADERHVTIHTLEELRMAHQMPIHDG